MCVFFRIDLTSLVSGRGREKKRTTHTRCCGGFCGVGGSQRAGNTSLGVWKGETEEIVEAEKAVAMALNGGLMPYKGPAGLWSSHCCMLSKEWWGEDGEVGFEVDEDTLFLQYKKVTN